MTDAELRALVRDAVARRFGRTGSEPEALVVAPAVGMPSAGRSAFSGHASHDVYVALVNVDGSCVIEPSVACDHCGYCKSHGH